MIDCLNIIEMSSLHVYNFYKFKISQEFKNKDFFDYLLESVEEKAGEQFRDIFYLFLSSTLLAVVLISVIGSCCLSARKQK